MNIKPRTYSEALTLSICNQIKQNVPTLTDAVYEEMYRFLRTNPKNMVLVSGGALYYVDASGKKMHVCNVELSPRIESILAYSKSVKVLNVHDSSGCSGCSGCSGNNNNNNNNNG